jgi:hypothetical protein
VIENISLSELIRPRPLPLTRPRGRVRNVTANVFRPLFSRSETSNGELPKSSYEAKGSSPIPPGPDPPTRFVIEPSCSRYVSDKCLHFSSKPNPVATPAGPSKQSSDDMRAPLHPYEVLIRKLRSSQNVISFVIAFSATMASTQPLVVDHTASITLAVIGIVSAGASMASLLIGKVIIKLEAIVVENELMTGQVSS